MIPISYQLSLTNPYPTNLPCPGDAGGGPGGEHVGRDVLLTIGPIEDGWAEEEETSV